jgi:hypothetical protein
MPTNLGTYKGSAHYYYEVVEGSVVLHWYRPDGSGSTVIPIGVVVDLYHQINPPDLLNEVGEDVDSLGYCLL